MTIFKCSNIVKWQCVTDTFWTNPQYRVEVIDPDEDDDDKMGTIIVGLMQKERRKMRELGLELLTMGYAIYKVLP